MTTTAQIDNNHSQVSRGFRILLGALTPYMVNELYNVFGGLWWENAVYGKLYDPVEFFARTYVTEGMTGLLEQSLRRVCGKEGEPVIQLKTAFGGGKTHSMLALYHMMRGTVSIDKIPNVKPVMERSGVSALPKANVVVLVESAIDPSKNKRPNYMPGITINTLWGEMAAQLAESAGNPKLYDYVKESDKKGVSPGMEKIGIKTDLQSGI